MWKYDTLVLLFSTSDVIVIVISVFKTVVFYINILLEPIENPEVHKIVILFVPQQLPFVMCWSVACVLNLYFIVFFFLC